MSAELESVADRKEKKRRRSKRVTEDNAEADVKPKEKKVKKKSKEERVSEDGTAGAESPSRAEKGRKRKHHKADVNNEVPDAVNNHEVGEPSKKKRKKERKDGESSEAVDVEDIDVEKVKHSKAKKSKKSSSKHKDERSEEAVDSGDSSTAKHKKSSKDKKKRRKDREENGSALPFPDPSADTELTEKARGALSYVYTRLSSPDSWKFNKAHQNWIVKHLFSPDDIAEKYLPIVAGYLSGCQGGVRENLIQTCNKHLDPKAEPPDSITLAPDAPKEVSTTDAASKEPAREDVVLSPEVQETVKARARVILKSLGCAPPDL
ncbi:hypothetical protein M0805_000090 [Coniferiporia weirii]|nr:hypothetical protein M0805_000090 [Coniferiporia weirii]